jgi:hypothetical protein
MKGVGQILGGLQANAQGKYNKKLAYRNAQQREAAGVMERERIRLAARLADGQEINSQGASGFTVGEGSALDALRASATNREMDILTSRFNASSAATASRLQGNQAKAQGRQQMIGGLISGAATIAEQVASAAFGGAGAGGFDYAGANADPGAFAVNIGDTPYMGAGL